LLRFIEENFGIEPGALDSPTPAPIKTLLASSISR
jgi:hypothetical protein